MKRYQKLPELDDFESYRPMAATLHAAREAETDSDEGLSRGQLILV
jgi:hypothetical protein